MAGAFLGARLLESMVFEVSVRDPVELDTGGSGNTSRSCGGVQSRIAQQAPTDATIVDEMYASTGAVVLGRRMFDVGFQP